MKTQDWFGPLAMDRVFARVFRIYGSRWGAFTKATTVAIVSFTFPMVWFQGSLEAVLSDPVFLFHLTTCTTRIECFLEFCWRLYVEWKEQFHLGMALGFLFTAPFLAILAQISMTQMTLDFYQSQNDNTNCFKAKRRSKPQGRTQNFCARVGTGLVLVLGSFLSATVVPILLGPIPLYMGWIQGIKPVWIAFGIVSFLIALLRLATPYLLAHPAVVMQGYRRSGKLVRQAHFEVWFSHMLLLFLHVLVARIVRGVLSKGGGAVGQRWWPAAIQHLFSQLVFGPCLVILQGDLYWHCSLHVQNSQAQDPAVPNSFKGLQVGPAEDDSTENDSALLAESKIV